MSVILQKDKITGETLVYETTNYRDKKTGKSGTKKELLGSLSTSALSRDYSDVRKMFSEFWSYEDEEEEVPTLEELRTAWRDTNKGMMEAMALLADREAESGTEDYTFSQADMDAVVEKFTDSLESKDDVFYKFKAFLVEVISAAATEVRENERLIEENDTDWESLSKDAKQVLLMSQEIDTYKQLNESANRMQKNMSEHIDQLTNELTAQDKTIEKLKERLSKYEDLSGWDDLEDTDGAKPAENGPVSVDE